MSRSNVHSRNPANLRSLLRIEFADNAALPHDDDPVSQTHNFGQIGRNKQDCDPRTCQFAKNAVDLELGDDIHPARGFFDNQDIGSRGEPLRQQHLLLIAA
jgi:hypothetical protein